MVICCDTSFLFSFYGDDVHSPKALNWLAKCKTPLGLSKLNEFELANALRFAAFRQVYTPKFVAECLADFENDQLEGRIQILPTNLAAVLTEAHRLSETHTLVGGHRSFDILHVAAALQLKADVFLTFDHNQRLLAEAEGLEVPLVE